VDDHQLTEEPSDIEQGPPPKATLSLLERPISMWQRVLILVWPVLLQQWLNLSVPLWDTYLAGNSTKLQGDEQTASQAAQTTAGYMMWCILCYTVFVSVGATALVARFTGAGNRRDANHAANQALLLAVVFGLFGSVLGLTCMPYLLELLQLRGEVLELANAYLRPLCWLLVFQMIEQAGIGCLVGAGDTRTGSIVLGCVAIINVPLAWFFQDRFGFTGIAVGTALSHTLGALAVLTVLWRGRAGLSIQARLLVPNWDLIWRLLRVGLPAGADSMSVAVAQLWFLSIVNAMHNPDATAAHGIALRWEGLGYQSGAAFGTVAMTLAGQYLGAGRPALASRGVWTTYARGGGLMSLMGLGFFVLAPSMFHVSCPFRHQQPIIDVGVPVLRLVAFAMPAVAATTIFTAALRGAGDTRIPVLFTWFGFLVIRIPLAYCLTRSELDFGTLGVVAGGNLGLWGAWLAMFADLNVRGAFFLWRFASGRWQRIRV